MQLDLVLKQDLESNIFKENLFNKTNVISLPYSFNFDECMKSVDIPNKNFINKFQRKNELFKCVKSYYYRFKSNDFDDINGILQEFEIKPFNRPRVKLISKIIEKTNGKYPKNGLPQMWRLKCINNPNIQFCYYEVSNNIYRVVAIDIYHLFCPTEDPDYKSLGRDGRGKYQMYKDSKIDLSEILK